MYKTKKQKNKKTKKTKTKNESPLAAQAAARTPVRKSNFECF